MVDSIHEQVSADLSRFYERRVASVVDDLRHLADRLERSQIRTSLEDLKPDHLAHARDLIHSVMTLMPNLGLEGLIRAAQEADKIVREDPS